MTKSHLQFDLSDPKFLLGLGIAGIAFAAHLSRQAAKPAHVKAEEDAARRERHRAKMRYEANLKAAYDLDWERWRQFDSDPEAAASFDSEYVIPIAAPPAEGTVECSRGGSLWATSETYIVSDNGEQLRLSLEHDGKYLSVSLSSPTQSYSFQGSYTDTRLIIGTCRGSPSAQQRRIASMIGRIQAEGYLVGKAPVAVFEDYWELRHRCYARYAAARGWPAERDAETTRVRNEYYGPPRRER